MIESRMSFLEFCASTVAERRNQVRMLLWTLMWMVVWVGIAWVGIAWVGKRGWLPATGAGIGKRRYR